MILLLTTLISNEISTMTTTRGRRSFFVASFLSPQQPAARTGSTAVHPFIEGVDREVAASSSSLPSMACHEQGRNAALSSTFVHHSPLPPSLTSTVELHAVSDIGVAVDEGCDSEHSCVDFLSAASVKDTSTVLETGSKADESDAADSIARRNLLRSMLAVASSAESAMLFRPSEASAMQGEDCTVDFARPTAGAAIATSVNIVKPPMDDRDYETFVLDNGLRVLLCSDPKSTSAAAAIDVHVGACSDPVQIPVSSLPMLECIPNIIVFVVGSVVAV